MKNTNFSLLIVLLIMACSLPSITGFLNQDTSLSYSGVVFNPIDGYTYLAKMQIGISGDWLFSLPFTHQAGDGRFLYPFYIAAGHGMRLINTTPAVGFTLLRILSYILLILSLVKVAKSIFPENRTAMRLGVVLSGFGGGLGWILLPFGNFGADFWVSEAFPFLSGLANPHFPLALSLMVVSILLPGQILRGRNLVFFLLSGLVLSILSPFGFVLSAGVLLASWLWERLEGTNSQVWQIILYIFAGSPYCIYQFWAVHSTPQFAAWTAQNITPAPAAWDVLLTFSPWVILIVFCWNEIIRMRKSRIIRNLITWIVIGLVFTLIPIGLQRRFMIGLSIPFTLLGLLSLPIVAHKLHFPIGKIQTICTSLVLITPILLVVMTTMAIATHNPLYYYKKGEMEAISWLSRQGDGRQVVLASPETGLMIPSISQLRVVYGHPFESIDAENAKKLVETFFSESKLDGVNNAQSMLNKYQVDWIFYGPREKELGSPAYLMDKKPAFEFGGVTLYNVRGQTP